MRLTPIFAAFLLGTSLLQAELTRTEITTKGAWTLNAVKDGGGKFIQSEMVRTFDGKSEIDLRIGFDGGSFHIDSSGDWSDVPEAKSYQAEYRINNANGDASWKGKATVIEDTNGKPWLRITLPNEPGTGDGLANGNTLIIKVGVGAKAVDWAFDLKGSSGAYQTMVEEYMKNSQNSQGSQVSSAAKPARKAINSIEHDYARVGDWAVHYYINSKGKFVAASMIRFYDNGDMLRVTRDATHFHLDTQSDIKKLPGAAKDKSTSNLKITIASDEAPDDESPGYKGSVIDEEGDKWLRISQSYEEPGGLEDGIRNAGSLRLKFGNDKFWSFNLKGSNAARKNLDECFDKFNK